MKRQDLERKLRIAGCYLKREGSSHSLQSAMSILVIQWMFEIRYGVYK